MGPIPSPLAHLPAPDAPGINERQSKGILCCCGKCSTRESKGQSTTGSSCGSQIRPTVCYHCPTSCWVLSTAMALRGQAIAQRLRSQKTSLIQYRGSAQCLPLKLASLQQARRKEVVGQSQNSRAQTETGRAGPQGRNRGTLFASNPVSSR